MRDRISWGLYITTFVFFIGISHAGTLISAILRVTQARWRTPVTRMAEFITAVALACGALFVIIDLGRPDRVLNVVIYGRWQSPIIWDVVAITTYLTASIMYLFLPMIPDLALFRDRLPGQVPAWRSWLYRAWPLAGKATQRSAGPSKSAITLMMVLIIPIAVSVHTVVSWIFAMTLREPWNSTIFGAFFVAGAIFSGIAMLIIVMAVLRKVYHLEEYITEKHFVYLGYLLAALAADHDLRQPLGVHHDRLQARRGGRVPLQAALPRPVRRLLLVLLRRRPGAAGSCSCCSRGRRNIRGVVAAAVLVVGRHVGRAVLHRRGRPARAADAVRAVQLRTDWVEWSVMAAGFALFALLITLFVKLFPIISVWEMAESTSTR